MLVIFHIACWLSTWFAIYAIDIYAPAERFCPQTPFIAFIIGATRRHFLPSPGLPMPIFSCRARYEFIRPCRAQDAIRPMIAIVDDDAPP